MIAIFIPAYNCGRTIEETLYSLQKVEKGWDGVYGLFICDDASTDNTRSVVKAVKFNRCNVNIFYHEVNRGESACYQTMIKALPPHVEWFIILHSDDLALENFLTRNIDIICQCPDKVASVSSNFYVFGNGQERLANDPQNLIVWRGSDPADIEYTARIGCWWHISGALIHRNSWELVGGREPSMPHSGDWDLIIKWQVAGSLVGHSLIPTTKYRLSSTNLSSRHYLHFIDIHERAQVVRRYPTVFPPSIRRRIAAQLTARTARRVVKLCLSGSIRSVEKGFSAWRTCLQLFNSV